MGLVSCLSFFTCLIPFFITINVNAQNGDWKQFFPEYNHLPYYPDVNVIEVDRFNNKWFGLNGYSNIYGEAGGLVKYDGNSWTRYQTTNSLLPDNNITAIAFDTYDNTWIGMRDSGIAVLKNDSIRLVREPLQFIDRGKIKSIVADEQGNIWFLYYYARYPGIIDKPYALMKFDGENWHNFEIDSLLSPGAGINCIAFDKNNNLYCGSYERILKYDGNNWEKIDLQNRKSALYLTSDPSNVIWVGIDGPGSGPNLLLYDNGMWKNTSEIYSDGTPSEIVFDNNGIVWTAGAFMGMGKYKDDKWEYFDRKNSAILWDRVNTLALDSTGTIWCGTSFGACTYDGENWKYYSSSDGSPSEWINKVVIDNENNKWVATQNFGIAKYDGNYWEIFNKSNSEIPYNDVNDIAMDSEGKIWAATSNGLGVFDGNLWHVYNEENTGYPVNNIFDVEIDGKGKIWATLFDRDALLSFDGNNWNIYNSENTILPEDFIGRLGIDKNDNIWLGTQDGFFIYDGINWTDFNIENSILPSNYIGCFGFDTSGNSWIGTSSGLVKIRDGEWEVFAIDNVGGWDIEEIAVDNSGQIWFGLFWDQGITKFDGYNWSHYNITFDPAFEGIDGMSIDFDKFGNLWIGSLQQGLLLFNEDKIVSVDAIKQISESKYEPLISVYPNPFNLQTNVNITLREASYVIVNIYSVTGELILSMDQNIFAEGTNTFKIHSGAFASGIYFCSFEITPVSSDQKQFYYKKLFLLK